MLRKEWWLIEYHIPFPKDCLILFLSILLLRDIFYFFDKNIPGLPEEDGQVTAEQVHHTPDFMLYSKGVTLSDDDLQ